MFLLYTLMFWLICGHLTLLLAFLNHDLNKGCIAKDYVSMLLMGPIGLLAQIGIMLTDWIGG